MVVCIVGRREKKKRIMTEPFKMDLLLQHSSVWCVYKPTGVRDRRMGPEMERVERQKEGLLFRMDGVK